MRALVVLAIVPAVCAARADTPLPPLTKVSRISPSERIRGVSDPEGGTRVEDAKRHKVLWSLPGWHRNLFVIYDSKHLVTQDDGLDLIPTDFTETLCCLRFGATRESFAM